MLRASKSFDRVAMEASGNDAEYYGMVAKKFMKNQFNSLRAMYKRYVGADRGGMYDVFYNPDKAFAERFVDGANKVW